MSFNKNDQLYGNLKIYNDNKLELQLCGGLKKQLKHNNINTINRFSQCEKNIELIKCSENNSNFSIPNKSYTPQYMIIGEHFACVDNIKISSESSSYTDLSK